MRKLMQVGLVFCFVGFVLFMIQLNRVDRAAAPQPKVVECDFYSVDAIYYSPGSAQEAKRKACEKKYYGYAESAKERLFNLGGVDLKISEPFGFVLHADKELSDPRSYRGSATVYITKSIVGMDGVINASGMGTGPGEKTILLEIGYTQSDKRVGDNIKRNMGMEWDYVGYDQELGMEKFIYYRDARWVTLLMSTADGNKLRLSCTHALNNAKPIECIAYRRILPGYGISYKIQWYVVDNWRKFDAAVLAYIFGMMGR